MNTPDNGHSKAYRIRGVRPETKEKYREAIALYRSTRIPCAEIGRICGVTESGLRSYIYKYHRDLLLARNDIPCSKEEARQINLNRSHRQLPATRIKYREAIEACRNREYLNLNLSQIARKYGVSPDGLSRQLRTHYHGIIEWREQERKKLGFSDNLPRGMRRFCKEQYTEAVNLLRGDSYITVQEVADSCGVSFSGLEQHLLFYHKDLVEKRSKIREKAVRQQRKGEVTGRGNIHALSPAVAEKYAGAVHLYRTTTMSIEQIAKQTQVSAQGLYAHLHTWHKELVCQRRNIPYGEGVPVDWSKVRKYNPATKAKYAEAIRKLKESDLPTAKVATEFGLHPECFRQYLKEHEPELYARQGMIRTAQGSMALSRSMERYGEAMHLYATTTESLNSLAKRFGVNACSLRQFIKRHFPEMIEKRQELLRQAKSG